MPDTPDVQTSGPPAVSIVSDGLPVLSEQYLFDEDQMPHRPDLVKKAKEFLHTGKIVDSDDDLVAKACEALVLGTSARAVAGMFRVSRNTVAHWVEALETAGKLEPHKKRMSKKLGRLTEACLDSLTRKAENGTLPSNIEVITLGIGIDKKGQIDAGVVPGTDLREPDLDPEALRAKWRAMKQAKVIDVQPAESQSIASPPKPV